MQMTKVKSFVISVAALAAACGGGTRVTPVEMLPGGTITVRAGAGAPLEGVDVTVYAIDPVTGLPIADRAGGSVLAAATRSSATGELVLNLGEDVTWDGPIQVVVTGSDITYVDPTGEGGSTRVSLPSSFRMTSFVPRYVSGTAVVVPVTLWTSLADAAALAYAKGENPASTAPSPIETALPLIDGLFAKHVGSNPAWDLRTTVPVAVNAEAGTVRDVVFAALADIALNQLARDISVTAGQPPGAVITAYQLLELLRDDISDGLFNGREGEVQLEAKGGIYALTSRTTRFDLARALGAFLDAPANVTGLTRLALENSSVFESITLDRSLLYPKDEDPKNFDRFPPVLELLEPLPAFVSAGRLTVRVRAEDHAAGVARVRAAVQTGIGDKLFEAQRVEGHWEVELLLNSGSNTVLVWAEDAAVPSNIGRTLGAPFSVRGTIILDASTPSITPRGAPSYRSEADAALKLENGVPVVPGALALTGDLVDLGNKTAIQKTYVTSSWGTTPPTGADLEGANPLNLPFRQFAVAFGTDELAAPFKAAAWRFEASDDGWVSTHQSNGMAIPSAIQDEGNLIFDVVFSKETIPILATTAARTVDLRLFFSATDDAGNTTEVGPFWHSYELLDTPLHFAVDHGYQEREAPGSIYAYFTNRELYRELFNPTNHSITGAGTARIGRISVLNPWALPVTIRQSNSPYFSLSEMWSTSTKALEGATVSMDGFTFQRIHNWAAQGTPGEESCLLVYDSVCGFGWRNTKHIRHDKWSTTGIVCGSGKTPPAKTWKTPASLTVSHHSARYVLVEANTVSGDGEVLAERMSDGAVVVPAAAAGNAGRVTVFPGIGAGALDREWGAAWDRETSFVQVAGLLYVDKGAGAWCQNDLGPRESAVQYHAEEWNQTLLSARSVMSGSQLAFRVRPVYVNGDVGVETGPVPADTPVSFSVDFNHSAE